MEKQHEKNLVSNEVERITCNKFFSIGIFISLHINNLRKGAANDSASQATNGRRQAADAGVEKQTVFALTKPEFWAGPPW